MAAGIDERLVFTTVADKEQAATLARALVEKRLAACVTCLPGATSYFRWESEAVGEEPEVVLLIKTHRLKLAELEACFETEHPYELPEFIVFNPDALSTAYGNWMLGELHLARP